MSLTSELPTEQTVLESEMLQQSPISKHLSNQSLKHLSTIHSEISWLKIWDTALDCGVRGSRVALCVFNTLSRPLFGDRLCPRCEVSIAEDSTYLEHLSFHHPELNLWSAEDIITALTSASPDIFSVPCFLPKTVMPF